MSGGLSVAEEASVVTVDSAAAFAAAPAELDLTTVVPAEAAAEEPPPPPPPPSWPKDCAEFEFEPLEEENYFRTVQVGAIKQKVLLNCDHNDLSSPFSSRSATCIASPTRLPSAATRPTTRPTASASTPSSPRSSPSSPSSSST